MTDNLAARIAALDAIRNAHTALTLNIDPATVAVVAQAQATAAMAFAMLSAGDTPEWDVFCGAIDLETGVRCTRYVDHNGDHGGFPRGPGLAAVPVRWRA